MKKIMALVLSAVMTLCLFAGCGTKTESKNFKIVTTIYPVYNWLQNITDGAENVELTLTMLRTHILRITTANIRFPCLTSSATTPKARRKLRECSLRTTRMKARWTSTFGSQ